MSSTSPASKFRIQKPSLRSIIKWFFITFAALWVFAALLLLLARWIDPPTTAVHMERRFQAFIHGKPYTERFKFVPISQISPNLQHAVVAAEDGNFYKHHGFDWEAIQKAANEDMEGERMRGGSTITQQLVKNLYFGTSRSFIRKGAETTLVPICELFLSKQRILELYLNLVEWGPGVYGADAAAHYHYGIAARNLDREEAARLAAVLPAPLKRKPARMTNYHNIILDRMRLMGW